MKKFFIIRLKIDIVNRKYHIGYIEHVINGIDGKKLREIESKLHINDVSEIFFESQKKRRIIFMRRFNRCQLVSADH